MNWIILICFLIYFTYYDIKYRIVSNKAIIIFLFVGIFTTFITGNIDIWINSIIGGIGAFLIFFIGAILSKGGIGMGDVKLMTCIGFYTSIYEVLNISFISLLVSVLIGLFLIFFKKADKKTEIPFVPFVLVGVIIEAFLLFL